MLRNRSGMLGVMETPWDSFGPVPPLDGLDYGAIDDELQQ